MQNPFKTIGILGKPSAPSITETLASLYGFLKRQQYRVFIDRDSAALLDVSAGESCGLADFGRHCDLMIVAGGDGTFLTAARAIADSDIPLVGVNLGRLGFLTDISPDDLTAKLHSILHGRYCEEKRYPLRAKIVRGEHVINEEIAFNEVVVHRWVTPSMIEIMTAIDGAYLNTQRSDGLVVSTPTGSTAYALSAGGPILHPALNALVLVPLNPHTLSNRPIVIDDAAEIEISFCQTKQINALVTCDHVEIPDVSIGDKILIKKSPKPIRMLHPEDHDFYDILRKKLNWSSGYHI
jgi:NAD+ kinase